VIQINPRQRDTEPTTLAEIADRRNELSGNLSLYQELAFIEKCRLPTSAYQTAPQVGVRDQRPAGLAAQPPPPRGGLQLRPPSVSFSPMAR
jgi:hypothetical protein